MIHQQAQTEPKQNASGDSVNRHRYRIRFAKQGDLRLTGHRDLVRLFERMLRRADLRLAMTQGFHPKPKMTFPSALALGVAGLDEVMELELANPQIPDALKELLSQHAPPGLVIKSIELLGAGARKARVQSVWLEMPVPSSHRAPIDARIRTLMEADQWHVQRAGRKRPIDIRSYIEEMYLTEEMLKVKVRVTPDGTVRPREILEVLVESDPEDLGSALTRAAVELEP